MSIKPRVLPVFVFAIRFVNIDPAAGWLNFVGYGVTVIVLFGVLLAGMLYLTTQGMRDFVARYMNLVKHLKQ